MPPDAVRHTRGPRHKGAVTGEAVEFSLGKGRPTGKGRGSARDKRHSFSTTSLSRKALRTLQSRSQT